MSEALKKLMTKRVVSPTAARVLSGPKLDELEQAEIARKAIEDAEKRQRTYNSISGVRG